MVTPELRASAVPVLPTAVVDTAALVPDTGRERARPGAPRRVGYLYLLPALLLYGVFVLAPALHTLWLSFFHWDGVTPATWAGLENYGKLFTDEALRQAFLHSLVLIVFFSVVPLGLGLLAASAIARSAIRGSTFFRTVLFLPQVISMVAIALIWRWIYAFDGPLNSALRGVGLGGLAHDWLGGFGTALPAVGAVGTWVEFGLCMVLFLAGIQKIPATLYDAARVDGAGPLREFFAVTLPALRGELVVAATLTVVAALRSFDLIYITTRGGPGTQTTVPALEIYNRAFVYGNVGSAAAVATVLAALIALIAIALGRLGERGA